MHQLNWNERQKSESPVCCVRVMWAVTRESDPTARCVVICPSRDLTGAWCGPHLRPLTKMKVWGHTVTVLTCVCRCLDCLVSTYSPVCPPVSPHQSSGHQGPQYPPRPASQSLPCPASSSSPSLSNLSSLTRSSTDLVVRSLLNIPVAARDCPPAAAVSGVPGPLQTLHHIPRPPRDWVYGVSAPVYSLSTLSCSPG